MHPSSFIHLPVYRYPKSNQSGLGNQLDSEQTLPLNQ